MPQGDDIRGIDDHLHRRVAFIAQPALQVFERDTQEQREAILAEQRVRGGPKRTNVRVSHRRRLSEHARLPAALCPRSSTEAGNPNLPVAV